MGEFVLFGKDVVSTIGASPPPPSPLPSIFHTSFEMHFDSICFFQKVVILSLQDMNVVASPLLRAPVSFRPAFFDTVGDAVFTWEWVLLGKLLCAAGIAERKTAAVPKRRMRAADSSSPTPSSSWRLVNVKKRTADALFWLIPTVFTAAGMLSSDVELWYWTLATTFATLAVGCLSACAVLQLLSIGVGRKIQANKAFMTPLVLQEAKETVRVRVCACVFARAFFGARTCLLTDPSP